jgi:predicted ferric reductase
MPILSIVRWLSIPLLVLAATAGPVYWAFPEGLSAARSLGIVLGWAGCGLLLASLLLMLRETWLSRWLGGLERMYQWHHRAGMAAYVLLLAHPLVLAADAWPDSPLLAWQTLSPFSQGWAVGLGWLSLLLLMLGLAAAFATRLPYRIWRWLHVSLGIGVLLGYGTCCNSASKNRSCRFWDWPAFFLAGGCSGRISGWPPGRTSCRRPLRLPTGSLKSPSNLWQSRLPQRPGSSFWSPSSPGRRSGVAANFILSPSVRWLPTMQSGSASRRWATAPDTSRPSSPVSWRGVHGAFGTFLADRPAAAQLWVAGGIGITPFLALLRAAQVSQPTTLVYLYRTEGDAAFLSELLELAERDPLLSLHALASGNEPPNLDSFLPERGQLAGVECYLCGPPGMVAAVRQALRRRGITARHIHFENFGFR